MTTFIVFATGCSTIYSAAGNGNLAAVKKYLQDGIDVNARTSAGRTPLIFAAQDGRLDMVKYLVGKGADVKREGQERVDAADVGYGRGSSGCG